MFAAAGRGRRRVLALIGRALGERLESRLFAAGMAAEGGRKLERAVADLGRVQELFVNGTVQPLFDAPFVPMFALLGGAAAGAARRLSPPRADRPRRDGLRLSRGARLRRFCAVAAIKIIKPGLLSRSLVERFRRERQVLARLTHEGIAQLFDGGETEDGAPYIVMEYVHGRPLLDWVEDEMPPLGRRLALFREACAAVAFAHANLVVDRDITPSNILVTGDGRAKLIDFGIARPFDAVGDAAPVSSSASLSLTPGLCRSGADDQRGGDHRDRHLLPGGAIVPPSSCAAIAPGSRRRRQHCCCSSWRWRCIVECRPAIECIGDIEEQLAAAERASLAERVGDIQVEQRVRAHLVRAARGQAIDGRDRRHRRSRPVAIAADGVCKNGGADRPDVPTDVGARLGLMEGKVLLNPVVFSTLNVVPPRSFWSNLVK